MNGEHVQILRGGAQKISRVVAANALEVQTLKLAPLVQGANRIVTSSQQPWALTATVTGSANCCQPVAFFGSSTLPSITKQAAAEAASAASMHQALSAGAPAVAVKPGVISDHE